MKNRQIRLIIGVLTGLVLFTSSLAFLFYTKQDKALSSVDEVLSVYVAKNNIVRGKMITAEDLELSKLPKSHLLTTPLSDVEIIGRYANVDIYAKELIRAEKLALLEPKEQEVVKNKEVKISQESSEEEVVKPDTLTLPLSLFQNLDTTLKAGERIDIVSILPKKLQSRDEDFDTKYVATGVIIDSFVFGVTTLKTPVMEAEKSLVYADSVVFAMSPKEIKNFFELYYKSQGINANRVYNKENKGHLWMVKCSRNDDVKEQRVKERLMLDYVRPYIRQKAVERVSISYEE